MIVWVASRLNSCLLGILALAIANAHAASPDRLTIWDLEAGTKAGDIADGFVDYACGTRGGPPSRPLKHFRDFAECRVESSGLREVYFRYDDELEYIARAMEQARAIDIFGGTRVMGVPAIVSALLDEAGGLRGIRIATDPRGADPGDRNIHWSLGTMLRHHFGDEDWSCVVEPASNGETPVSTYLIKDRCSKTAGSAELSISREYLHRRGQHFVDEFGKVQPSSFVSRTLFEMLFTASDTPKER